MKLSQTLSQLLVEYTDLQLKRSIVMLNPRLFQQSEICACKLLTHLVGKASAPATSAPQIQRLYNG